MKKMKRLVAILLASVMALVMLTACGEEAPQSLGQRAEKVLMDSLNKAYNTSYENDADLKNKVTAVLNKIDENGEIAATDIPLAYLEGSYNFPGYLEEKDNTYIATYLMVASASGSGKKLKALEVTEESLKNALLALPLPLVKSRMQLVWLRLRRMARPILVLHSKWLSISK